MTTVETARHVERVVGRGSDDFDRVRSRVESLMRIGSVPLIIPSRVTMARGDAVAVAEPPREHDTLSSVLDARGALRAGECVWVGTAVAEALTILHKAGLAHGALDADAVVIDEGRVCLARLVDGADDASAPDDIAALGRLLATAVKETDSARIAAWTEPMTHPDPSGRPTAAMVMRALASCAPAEQLHVEPAGVAGALRRAAVAWSVGGDSTEVVALPEARGWRLRLRAREWLTRIGVVAAVAIVVVGVGVAVALNAGDDDHAGSADIAAGASAEAAAVDAPDAPDAPDASNAAAAAQALVAVADPAAAAEWLTTARFDSLSHGDGVALIALTAPGSAARADAEETAAALEDGSLSIEDLAGTVLEAVAEDAATEGAGTTDQPTVGHTALVRVTYLLGPHTVVADGVATTYDAYQQTVGLTLAWTADSGWLVSDAVSVTGVAG